MYLKVLAPLAISLVVVFSCRTQSFDQKLDSLYSRTVPLITVEEAKVWIMEADPIILDTRSIEEYGVSHLSNASFVDYKSFDPRQYEDQDRSKPIIVYCSVGYRSERIGEKLIEMGFSDVRNIYGGIFEWKNKDQEIVNNQGYPTDSVHTYNKSWSKWLTKGIKVYE